MKYNLTDNERYLLLAMTYIYGCKANMDEICNFASALIGGRRRTEMNFSILIDKGLIVKDPRYPYSYPKCYTLRRGLFLPLLKELLSDKCKDTYNLIKKTHNEVFHGRSLSNEMLYAMLLVTGKKSASLRPASSPPKNFYDECTIILDDKDFYDFFRSMPDDTFRTCLVKRLSDVLIADDEFDWEYVKQLIEDRPKTDLFGNEGVVSCFNYFYYLATGKMCADISSLPVNVYTLCTLAVKTLYTGSYDNAYKVFTKAMTAHNKLTLDGKGFFSDDVTNYYYVLCLLLTNTDTSLRKFDMFCKKLLSNYWSYRNIIFSTLYDYFREHTNPSVDDSSLENIIVRGNASGMMWIVWMIIKKLEAWPENVKEPSLTKHTPRAAWLRAELSSTGVIPQNDGSNLLLGGTSLFGRLEVKALWQLKLEEIINETSADDASDGIDSSQQERVIYTIRYGYIEIILQKRRKNGGWTVGRHIDASTLKRLNEPWLDETDQRFISHLDPWDSHLDVEKHIADLVGCDHIYADDACTLPVNIHEDKPFLVIDKHRNGTFTVKAHPSDIVTSYNETIFIVRNSATDYSIFRPSAFEKKIYNQILSQKSYPAEAEPLLKKLIATIGGRTEIHSNMVVENDELKKVEAATKITIRCVPQQKELFGINLLVHAFGSMSFLPGKGAVTTVAEENGKRVQVVRKLKVEKENLKIILAEFADLGIIEDEDDWSPKSVADMHPLTVGELLPLLDWTKDNSDICEMEWPEGARVKYHPVLGTRGVSVNITSKNGWFDVEGDIKINDQQVISLQRMLELMHEANQSKYIRIGNDEYITLSRDLSKILKRLDTVTTEKRNHLQMSTAAVGLIGDVLDNKDITVKRSKAVDEIRKRIKDSAKLQFNVPKTLHADLRDYQETGYEWMERTTSWGAGVCLADDMGLGKTVQTIAVLLEEQANGPSLIVAPASVVPNWRNELRRFAPTLGVVVLNDAEDRTEAINSAKDGDVVVTTYALLNNEQDSLTKKEWNVVCLDEAHTIKNPNTKMSKAAMMLQAKKKIELTGTPIQNHLSELWNLFQFINPGLLGSFEQFSKKYIMPVEADHNKERQNQLKRLISPFLLRRTKGEVIEELPEKNEIVVPVELSSDEMTMYEVRRREAVEAVKSSKIVKVSTLAEITHLRQMACSCSLVDKKWKRTSSKIEAFIDLAENLNDSGNRALVFSQFTSFFSEVRKAMDKAKLPYLYLDGTTPMKQREKLVSEFQKGKCPFFLISLKAGGLGLNLTGANYVIHLDPWWNPAIEQQATDRAYRIGQKQDVTVYHLISQHTIEEKILRLHKTKRDLADSLLEGTDMSHTLTQEELLELLK